MESEKKETLTVKYLGVDPVKLMNEMPVKRNPTYMRKGFMYWTGAMITIAFMYQIVTGLMLLMYYDPSHPYTSTQTMLTTVPYAVLIDSTHLYGAFAMVVLVYVHLFRNYFAGAYKRPRQLQWILGVVLLGLTIGVCFFGYSMPGDILGADASSIGANMAAQTPYIGGMISTILFGNNSSTASLYQRLLGWHIVLALLVGVLFAIHFFLAESHNIMPSAKESKHRAPAIIEEDDTMKQWYPYNFVFMLQLTLFVVGFILLIPSIIGLLQGVPSLFSPLPGPSRNSPLAGNAIAYPDYPPWFLLFVYKAVDFLPGFIQVSAPGFSMALYGPLVATAIFGGIPLVFLLVLPFIDRNDDLHPLKRPVITGLGIYLLLYLVVLSVWGALTPGVPISLPAVGAVLGIPFVIIILGMYLIGRLYKSGKLDITYDKIMTSFYLFLIMLMMGIYFLAINFHQFLSDSTGGNLIDTFVAGLTTSFAAVGVAKAGSTGSAMKSVAASKPVSYKMSPNSATVLSTILLLISVAIMVLIFNLSPTVVSEEFLFGAGLGIVFILSGFITRLYRLVNYDE
ncbi:MAG: cytochrome bc complex cytochrome b subunit [Candidatus Thermoplasmatota archaeon]|nr:cytochrome bc complex cytochrome b subunit [Candidatus Thermoplasmatota archaeon]